ncbi:MAG: carbohydrate kinase family protein [Ignavibacteriaceae bacterium]
MKILVIGHSVEDHIHMENRSTLQPGGIYYTVAALNAIINDTDELFLCTAVEENNYSLFAPAYEMVNRKFLQTVDEIPKVHLTISKDSERGECYQNISDNLNTDFGDLNYFDGILINMITGYDISLKQLKKLRAEFKGIIYMDVHTLSRGVLPAERGLIREFRKIPQFDEWASAVDIIQVNQAEVKTISLYDDELQAVRSILVKEGQIVIVTKDRLGAGCYTLKNNKLLQMFEKAVEVKENNKIGCGDVFGAVFFYTYIKNGNLIDSLKKANKAAGSAASYSRLEDLKKLSEGTAY